MAYATAINEETEADSFAILQAKREFYKKHSITTIPTDLNNEQHSCLTAGAKTANSMNALHAVSPFDFIDNSDFDDGLYLHLTNEQYHKAEAIKSGLDLNPSTYQWQKRRRLIKSVCSQPLREEFAVLLCLNSICAEA